MAVHTYHKSKSHLARSLIIGAILSLLGGGIIYYVGRFAAESLSWLSYVGFGLLIAGGIQLGRSMQNPPVVRASANGLQARSLGNAVVKWSYIKGFELTTVDGEKVLVGKARNQQKLLKDMNHAVRAVMKANVKDYGAAIAFPEGMLSTPLETLADELERLRKAEK